MNVVIETDLRSKLTAVRDQGPRPTCLPHAATAAHEGFLEPLEFLSPEYLHYVAREGKPASGLTFTAVSKALRNKGQPAERDCPYQDQEPPADWKPSGSPRLYRRNSRHQANLGFPELSSLVKNGQVPVIGITLPDSFLEPRAPWIIPPEGRQHGLHAVAAVGLGRFKNRSLLLIRNSWGDSWADGGHAWLAEDFIRKHLQSALVLTSEVEA